MKRNRITRKSLSIALFVFAVGSALAASGAAWAKSAKTNHTTKAGDPTPFSTCRVLNGVNVLYSLTSNITASVGNITGTGTSACITVKGSHNGLLLNSHTITGPGTGAGAYTGINIIADHTMLEGFNATVQAFRTGIHGGADHTTGDDFNVEANGTGLLLTGNDQRWFNFFAGSLTETASPSSNGTGVSLNNCGSSCSVVNFDASGNTLDGVDVVKSADAVVELFIAANNGGDGVHLGYSEEGEDCVGNSDARVANAFFGPAVSGNVGDGVFLDTSESAAHDQVTTVHATRNGRYDLHDATTNCGSGPAFNLWYNNVFTTSLPVRNAATACID